MKSPRMDHLRQRALALLASRQEGSREGAAAIMHDMEVLQAELEVQQDELVESQKRASDLAAYYRQLFFDTPLALILLGEQNVIREVNARAAALLCLTPQRVTGGFDQYVASEDLIAWATLTAHVGTTAEPLTAELRVRRLGGERRRCVVTLTRHAEGLLLSLEDVTELRAAEADRRIADLRLARVLRDSRDGVLFADANTGLVTEVNGALAKALEFDPGEVVGRPLVELFHGASAVRQEVELRQRSRAGPGPLETAPIELTFATRSGNPLPTEATVGTLEEGPRRFVTLLLRDISERLRLASEREELARSMQQSQKLEALGALSAGVAHDINNMLTVILGCASSICPDTSASEMREVLEEIRAAARRGRDVTARLSALARRQPLRATTFELGSTLRELTTLLRHTLPANVEVELDLSAGSTLVAGDPGEWHHALLNLAINARDAMAAGGRLTFSTRRTARGLEVSVRDTGAGMAPDVLRRAFEPFFTTKPEGLGTGLGLAHVHAVARAHHVTLDCQSVVGQGTTFTLCFPLDAVAELARKSTSVELRATNARVLLVDDDEHARRATKRVLAQLGLDPVDVPSGTRALELLESNQKFDLVLSDLSMPGMDGGVLVQRVKGQWPDLPVAIITGDVRDTRRIELLSAGVCEVLHKPFEREELGALVARALR